MLIFFRYELWSLSRYWSFSEAAIQVFWKYAANLQENTHAEMWFQ